MTIRLTDVDLALALGEVHDELSAIFERLDEGRPISRHVVEDVLEKLADIGDALFDRGES